LRIRNRAYGLAAAVCSAFAANASGAAYAQTADYFATPWLGVPTQQPPTTTFASPNGSPQTAIPTPVPAPAPEATANQTGVLSNLYAQSLAAAQPAAPPVLVTFNAGIDEIATDNVAETETNRVSDLSSLFSLGTTVTSDSSRFTGALSGTGVYERNINDAGLDQFTEYAYGNGHATILPAALFFDLDGAVDNLSREGGGLQNALVQSGQATHSYTLAGSPYLRTNVDDIGINVLRYQIGQVWYGNNTSQLNSPGSNLGAISASTDQVAREDLRMPGTLLPRLLSDVSLSASENSQVNSPAGTLEVSSDELINEYEITRSASLIGGGGYEYLHDQDVPVVDDSGAIWDIGGRLRPNPDSSVLIDYGRHYGKSDFTGEIAWRLTPLTDVYTAYTDSLASSQQYQIGGILGSSLGPEGAVSGITYNQNPLIGVLDDTALSEEPAEQGLVPLGIPIATSGNYSPLQNGLFRIKTFSASGRTLMAGDPIVLTFYDVRDDSLTPQFAPSSSTDGVNLSWTLGLSPQLSGLALLGYARQSGAVETSIYNAALGTSYRLSDTLSLILRYDFIRNDAVPSSAGYLQNAVTIGLHKTFD
jgi:uncharacterized protein (PEP-CTERM system associated)